MTQKEKTEMNPELFYVSVAKGKTGTAFVRLADIVAVYNIEDFELQDVALPIGVKSHVNDDIQAVILTHYGALPCMCTAGELMGRIYDLS